MLRKVKPQSHKATTPQVLKDLLLCLLSGALLILSFPRFNIEFLAWFGFLPLFLTLRNKSKLKAFLLSYFTGIIFWFGTIYWLIHVTLPGMIVLVCYLALYFGLFGFIISTMNHEVSTMNLLFVPSLWVALEYIRSYLFTGFPWALLGHSQYLNLPVIQIAAVTGAWGVSFLVMLLNVALYSVLGSRFSVLARAPKTKHRTPRLRHYLAPIIFLAATFTYGYYQLYRTPDTRRQTPIKISVIQGNIPQELKWDEGSRAFIMDEYFRLTHQAAQDKPDLIIWPEAALPVIIEEEPEYFTKTRSFVKNIGIPLLLGAVTTLGGSYFNSAILISGEGEQLNKYDKLRLVPFGEYIPLRKILPFLEAVVPIGDFTSGKGYTVFKELRTMDHEPINFSVLICFEDLFPQLSGQFVKKGADFLVNITNDAWFGKTSSPYQHLCASVFRAVENRVAVVRAANTGISGFIFPSGKIIATVRGKRGEEIFTGGYKTEEIFSYKNNPSFFSRFGGLSIFLLFIFVLYSIFRLFKRRPR